MAYSVYNLPGAQPIATNETVQKHVLGTKVKGTDPVYLAGDFIYLLGVASTVVGSLVSYSKTTYQTALSADTAALATPVAVAMSACVAGEYGWYQIVGLAVVKKTNVKADPAVNANRVYQSAVTGRIMQTSVAGKCIMGATWANLATVTSTTSTVIVMLNNPHNQGPIT